MESSGIDPLTRHKGSVIFIAALHNEDADNEPSGYPIFTDNDSFDTSTYLRIVRGMIFTATGSRVEVMNHSASWSKNHSATTSDLATISSYSGAEDEGTFKLVLSSALGSDFGSAEGNSGLRIYTASLNPTSKHYIGKILNTNPDRFHEEQHLLYADFPVESEIAKVAYHASSATVGIVSGSTGTSAGSGDTSLSFRDMYGSFNTRYTAARTTSFISQPFGTREYDLFHFEMIDDGDVGNNKVKVSISNIRRSTNPKYSFGTFTILVRDFSDTDTNMKVLERYPLCNLDPDSEDYVANKLGDMKVYFNFDAETETERRLNVTGKRPNKSAYVRIQMNSLVEDREIPDTSLPFGFRGLPVLKTTDSLTDSTATLIESKGQTGGRLARQASRNGVSTELGSKPLTHAILPPVPLRFKATRGAVQQGASPKFTGYPGAKELADNRFFWGIKFERVPLTGSVSKALLSSNGSGASNNLIKSYSKFLGIEKLDALVTGSGADAFCNNKFTLARVALSNRTSAETGVLDTEINNMVTGAASDHMKEAAYIRNGKPASPQYTVADGQITRRLTFGSLVAAKSATKFNRFADYLKFTNMFYGGFDGLNIVDRDQRLMNDKATSIETQSGTAGGKAGGGTISYLNLHVDSHPGTGKFNNAISSYRTAARIITDPLATRVNVIAIPGIRDAYVTDYVSDLTRDYSKAIYIMDMPSYDDDTVRVYSDTTKNPNVRRTVEQFSARNLDNNYVASYFPDVILDDPINRSAVNVPSSIAAIGALAYNDSVAYPWFAPAGFNRGSLEGILNTKVRLTAEDRNILYDERINPIANFPRGGFVIFGQKTLQQARSALDRVNVRRMLLEVKRIVSDVANKLIFEQNTPSTRARFVSQVTPQLAMIQAQQGIDQFKVVMDSSNNTSEDIEQNRLNGKVILVPTRAVEFIAIDFIITNSGVSFE